jgi:hypothetical protein
VYRRCVINTRSLWSSWAPGTIEAKTVIVRSLYVSLKTCAPVAGTLLNWKCNCLETMTQPNTCPRRRGFKSSRSHHKSKFFWNQTSISYVNSPIKLNFDQSANFNLKPRTRYVFWIYVMSFQSSDTFHKEFVPS